MAEVRLPPELERARYGRRGSGDRFVGFWLALFVESRQGGGPRQIRRVVTSFVQDRQVSGAFADCGIAAVEAQLLDAARLYCASCLTDPSYSSSLFGLKRLAQDAVHARLAEDVARLAADLTAAGLDAPSAGLTQALVDGYLEAIAPRGPGELHRALNRRPVPGLRLPQP